MKKIVFIILCFPLVMTAQINELNQDSIEDEFVIIDGDTIRTMSIDLDEVMLLHKLKFDGKADKRRYLILRRKTIKVYPYAKLAAERLVTLNERIENIEKRSDKKKYARIIQRYIEDEFSEELKKLTRTEGQILVKLIHRQTGETTFTLVKNLRNGWRAFWFNTTANLFDISLKEEFDPLLNKEDYLIEDILQRNFQSGVLDRQKPALDLDFYELTNKWLKDDIKP